MSRTETRLDRIYELHSRSILAYCLRRGPRQDAYEAANEVFTVAWRRLDEAPPDERMLPWLYGVARNVMAHHRRSEARSTALRNKAATMPAPPPTGPEAVVVQREEYDSVRRAVDRLNPDDREMLLLSAWEGLTHAEIAEIMDYSLATVDKRLARAKERLRRQYDAVHKHHRPPTSTARGGDNA